MKYKFEEFSDIIIDPIITIGNEIIINKDNNTCIVNVLLMPMNKAVIFELPFNALEDIESQVNTKLIEFEYNGEHWHEDVQYRIKFTPIDILDMLKEVPAMFDYIHTLTIHEDMFQNQYVYVNYFADMERELLEYYGAIITERENI